MLECVFFNPVLLIRKPRHREECLPKCKHRFSSLDGSRVVRKPCANQSSAWCSLEGALPAGSAGEGRGSGPCAPDGGHERRSGDTAGKFCELSLGITGCFTETKTGTVLAAVGAWVRG